ncbi:MAG: hypothetical protein IPG39_17250 [Bacteroidetes bacterium]|nr:hypothetical protein [Bacteroidota bacterium]
MKRINELFATTPLIAAVVAGLIVKVLVADASGLFPITIGNVSEPE